ncbi:hypothetical protein Lalb_Chr06g0171011 [Lupinus albus]|uniref:Uncharacterized protein n=1 Tax=Lupinus albus TaxID=3870 RepID=A0A6A4QEJ8_LUPAL|nr:hypothetical protein Lalb_Chr06g0171011 [Lupinus albus]
MFLILLLKESNIYSLYLCNMRKYGWNFPMKIFLLFFCFYITNALATNALATILRQTGDCDVLVAGVVVAAIRRLQSFLMMMKY